MRLSLLLLLAFASPVFAFPQLLSLDGFLTNSSGSALNGSYSFNFTLYTAGGTALWTETQTLAVSSGKLNALLGSVTALHLPFDQDYYLGVKVSTDNEMAPRYRLAASAYSYKSKIADYSNRSGFAYASNPYAMPVLAMSFNEGSGQTAYDYSGLSNHGTLNGPSWTTGKIGGALQFDGVNDYVDAGNGASVNFNAMDFTISVWVKSLPLASKSMGLITKFDSNTQKRQYYLGMFTDGHPFNGAAFFLTGDGGANENTRLDGTTNTNDGNWHNIVGVWVAGSKSQLLYVDGVLENSNTGNPYQVVSSTSNVLIGRDVSSGNTWYEGTIDEARVYNRALTANEIKALYEAGLQ